MNFWSPKTDSVVSKRKEEIIKEVRQSNIAGKFILNTQTQTQSETAKSFFMNLFKPKAFEQSSLK
jgi:hypothetical protein